MMPQRARALLVSLISSQLLLCCFDTVQAETAAAAELFNKQNYAKAELIWKEQAQKGNPKSQFNLGILYDNGYGSELDEHSAISWYKRALDSGHPFAAFNLGSVYLEKNDLSKAIKFFKIGAKAGDTLAQVELAKIFEDLKYDIRDYENAFFWFLAAANSNHADAQFRVAQMLAIGKGVERDLDLSNEWMEKADVTVMTGNSVSACTPASSKYIAKCRRKVVH